MYLDAGKVGKYVPGAVGAFRKQVYALQMEQTCSDVCFSREDSITLSVKSPGKEENCKSAIN